MSMPNFRTNVLETVLMVWGCLVFHFLRFLLAGYRQSYLQDLSILVS